MNILTNVHAMCEDFKIDLPSSACEGAVDVAADHVQPEQRDAQRSRSRLTGRLQAHVAHRRSRHAVPDSTSDSGSREAAVKRGSEPAFQHQGS